MGGLRTNLETFSLYTDRHHAKNVQIDKNKIKIKTMLPFFLSSWMFGVFRNILFFTLLSLLQILNDDILSRMTKTKMNKYYL